MASLQDQLLKAGLSNEKNAKKIRKEKKKSNKAIRKGQLDQDTKLQDDIKAKKAEQVRLDNERNSAIQADIQRKSDLGKAKQMILQLHLTDIAGEVKFNYVLDSKVKELMVDQANYNALTRGQIGLCVLENKTYALPSIAVAKIKAVDDSFVLVLNENVQDDAADAEDDPYADFQIPDDLMW